MVIYVTILGKRSDVKHKASIQSNVLDEIYEIDMWLLLNMCHVSMVISNNHTSCLYGQGCS